ncbi:nucleotide exchange factor GrpE [Streptomyces sp. ISL-10]|uniref:nucleotide exchange factor GrpE n=1 Tax=Streptomyces sp. ISL-10 TaxID=2819172 RepID=UPI001BE5B61D|nr:nucleotide exchange factor GrpE [Streptomyces sp. ISL-10]MBT2365608.1 nucleotide exchange factor GrpE [Streptomyces sp. ISL-10]
MNREPRFGTGPDRRPPVIVHDRRRINPLTLQSRRPQAEDRGESAPHGPAAGQPHPQSDAGSPTEAAQLRAMVAALTADLQRVKAEYDNYRKRVQRDRLAIREIAVANVLAALLPVLDAVEAARGQRDGDGAEAVADLLGDRLAGLGLRTIGAVGEPFDPRAHEALTYTPSDDAAQAVCTAVLRHGYRVGDQLLRPAQVSVTGPPAGEERAGAVG